MEKALTHLLEPMDCNAPIKVMLQDIEDVQMFLLAHPEGDKEMSETQLIDYAVVCTPREWPAGKNETPGMRKNGWTM